MGLKTRIYEETYDEESWKTKTFFTAEFGSMSKKYKVNNGGLEADKKMDYSVVKDNLLFEIYSKREWLTTEEAADFLSISENALRIMVHRTQIRAYKLGRRLRFKLSDCEALIERKGA